MYNQSQAVDIYWNTVKPWRALLFMMTMTALMIMTMIHIILVLVSLITKKQNSASGHASESAGSLRCRHISPLVL